MELLDSESKEEAKRLKPMFFDFGKSTVRAAFVKSQLRNDPITEFKEMPVCSRKRPPPLKNVHTLTSWKGQSIPFSFFFKPKDIIGTNPWNVQESCVKPVDTERVEVQRTRPRLVVSPAVSMDDIKNPEARKMLIEDVYTSKMGQASKEATSEYFAVRAPFPGRPAPANPIFLKKLQPPVVPPCWRMESVTWERDQLRTICNTHEEFWKKYGSVYKCEKCQESRNVESHKKMIKQMKKKSIKTY